MKSGSPAKLDSFDRRILAILQRDNLTPQRQIGQEVNLSPAAVHRRIRRLNDAGVIAGNVALVDAKKAGRPTTVVVEVSVESERPAELDELRRAFVAAPEIQQCYYVTGESDFLLILTVEDMSEYEELTQRLFFGQGNVKRFRTLVVMQAAKVSLFIPT